MPRIQVAQKFPVGRTKEAPMNRSNIRRLSVITVLGLTSLPGNVIAQQRSLKEQLVGAWTMVLCEVVRPDGTKTPLVAGINPTGQYIFTDNGHFSFQAAADLPKLASNSRMNTTPEENKAVVQGSVAYYGTYTVNEVDKIIAFTSSAVRSQTRAGVTERELSLRSRRTK
jgi:hypothetical protein